MPSSIGTLLACAPLVLALLSGCGQARDGDKGKAGTPQATAEASPGAVATARMATPVQRGVVAAKVGKIDRSHAGSPAPAATFVQRNGQQRSIADFAGSPVLVNLWATWCAPCVAEMPALDRLMMGTEQLVVLPISQDLGGWQAVDGFFTPGRFRALVPYLDQPNALALALGAKGLPMSVLYDSHGREVWRVNGPLEWDSPKVAALIRDAG